MSRVARTPTEAGPQDDPRAHLSHPDALYEVVDGQIVEKPAMGTFAYLLADRLLDALKAYLAGNRLGVAVQEWFFQLDPDRDLRRKPDVAFVSADRWPLDRDVPEEGDWEVTPALAIEVVSPDDPYEMLTGKVREYFRYGVRQVWVVEPRGRRVAIFTGPSQVRFVDEGEELDAGDLLPGFRVDLKALFRRSLA